MIYLKLIKELRDEASFRERPYTAQLFNAPSEPLEEDLLPLQQAVQRSISERLVD